MYTIQYYLRSTQNYTLQDILHNFKHYYNFYKGGQKNNYSIIIIIITKFTFLTIYTKLSTTTKYIQFYTLQTINNRNLNFILQQEIKNLPYNCTIILLNKQQTILLNKHKINTLYNYLQIYYSTNNDNQESLINKIYYNQKLTFSIYTQQ